MREQHAETDNPTPETADGYDDRSNRRTPCDLLPTKQKILEEIAQEDTTIT